MKPAFSHGFFHTFTILTMASLGRAGASGANDLLDSALVSRGVVESGGIRPKPLNQLG